MNITTRIHHGLLACAAFHRYQLKDCDITAISLFPPWLDVNELLAGSIDKHQPTTADCCVASPPQCFSSARDQPHSQRYGRPKGTLWRAEENFSQVSLQYNPEVIY